MAKILEEPAPEFKTLTIKVLKLWKKIHFKNWKNFSPEEQLLKLRFLITVLYLAEENNEPIPKVEDSYKYAYNPSRNTVYLDTEHPSIISTLHELGHAIHGSSELKACRYSIWLFKTVFPKSFATLKTDGHLLRL